MTNFRLAALFLLLLSFQAAAQIAGRNVNMVSGTSWPNGDPFLQRQNEPSLAVSTRNQNHLLGGSNDYRTVDLPGLPSSETGDAWLGVYKSYDGGATWTSTVHPGCPQNVAACDGAPFLKSYAAGADAVVRAGTNGLFYFSGIAFTRTSPKQSVVFVSRFIDNNNEENGDPIKYLNTVPVSTGNNSTFIDKPWIAVDIPRAGAGTCQISTPQKNGTPVRQSFPAGNVYLAYTTFESETQPPSQILFSRSADCGATWSKPFIVADQVLNQGANLAIDPNNGNVYLTWRRFASTGVSPAIMFAQSTDGGQSFSSPQVVAEIAPFDQGTTTFSFRTNAYPTMAVDGSSRIYLAWSERNRGVAESGGDARIMLTTSRDGKRWTPRAPVSDYAGRGHQFMPAMTFAGGKVMVIFYDVRQDNTVGNFTSLGGSEYSEKRVPAGDLATTPPHPEKVFTNFLLDAAPSSLNLGGLLRRHTLDVFAAQAEPADLPVFGVARVSQYIFGSRQNSMLIEQLQVNPPNLPLFQSGSVPFMGDYLDIAAAPTFLPGAQPGTWKFNTEPSNATAFHAIWTDNRDVRPPANGDWTNYTPPISASSSGMSLFDPTQPQPACMTGQSGMRNQNIYTSLITQGLLVTSPSNAKSLGTMKRAFPINVSNSTNRLHTYRLSILTQPKGGKASFFQTPVAGAPDPYTVLDVNVAPGSSISRMVFVNSTDPNASVNVSVDEIPSVGSDKLLAGGLQGTIVLNPDPLNPTNPDIANTELFNPDIANPDIANPDIANPDIANPDIANPDIANPDIANPDIANPDIANPDIANPDIANPDIANPDIANPDIANGAISDATWKLTNKGNTTATYTVQFLIDRVIPSSIKSQLIINKTYSTPVANGCSLTTQPQTAVVANIVNPTLLNQKTLGRVRSVILAHARAHNGLRVAQPRDSVSDITDDGLDNATVSVGPGETLNITLRFYNPDKNTPLPFDPGKDITVITISHATNTGGTQPPIAATHLIIANTSLPAGVSGSSYDQLLIAAGGNQPVTWGLTKGTLPPGLTLTAGGEITGTITGDANLYNFTVQVSDSSSPANIQTANLSIQVSRVSLAFANLAAAGPNGSSVRPGDAITVTAVIANTGSPADSVAPNLSLAVTGTASANCGAPVPAAASLAGNAQQSFVFTCDSITGAGTLSFVIGITAVDRGSGAGISVSPGTTNPVTILANPPQLKVTATAGGAPYTSGAWTNQNVIVTFVCTPSTGAASTKTVTVTSEGANQAVTTTCTDLAGNSTDGSFGGINIDKTAPLVSASAFSGGQVYFGAITGQPVTITFTCTDAGGSGVAQAPPQQIVANDGMNQNATGVCTDRAGNSASASFSPINVVRTAPQLTPQYFAGNNAYTPGSWSNQGVTVSFQCVPAFGIPVSNVTSPVNVNADSSGQFVNGSCTDSAGNRATVVAGPVNVDKSAPIITILNRPPANPGGWYNSPVTFTWLCSDQGSGPQQGTISKTIASEGANQTVTATCTDLAGNTASASATASVDLTPPVINGQTSASLPASGWYRGGVGVSFSCSDSLSGVAAGYPLGSTTINLDTPGTPVTGTCRDQAGNVSSTTIGPIRIDTTPPYLALQSASPIGPTGWSNGPVTVTWACVDSGSGPVTPTVSTTVSVSGSASGSCSDVAGNSASTTYPGIRIDTVPPLLSFISPVNGFAYPQGASAFASYSCFDTQSGVASCTGTLPSGQLLNLSTPGNYSFTVTATDQAGNVTTVTRSYSVVPKP